MSFVATSVRPVRDRSLTEQVQETLETMLREGQLKPDDRTSIRDLASQLGVSTMPVRDAVSRLVAQGALAVERNRAIVVPRLSIEDFRDLTETRILIEGHAVEKATRRIARDEVDELRAINAAFEEAMLRPDAGDPVRLNQHLHFRLYDMAGSPALSRIIASNWLLAGPVINLDIGLPSRRMRNANSLASHAALITALAEQNVEDAVQALIRDIRTASEFIIDNAL